MSKQLFNGEYEFSASKKMLYPYLSTASGLSQWFADDVNINNADKTFTFLWDGDENKARMVAQRTNYLVKFEFMDDDDDPNYLEFKLEVNDLTQAVFFRIEDYSDVEDLQEAQDIWDNLIHNLKEIVGG